METKKHHKAYKDSTLIKDIRNISSNEIRELCHQFQEIDLSYLNNIISVMPDLFFLIDYNGKYINVYAEGKEHLLFAPKEELIGKYLSDIFNQELSTKFLSVIHKADQTQTLQRLEYQLTLKGKREYFELRAMPTQIVEEEEAVFVVVARSITSEKERDNISRLIETVFNQATEGIMIQDANRTIIHVNPAMQRMLNIKEDKVLGQCLDYFKGMIPSHTRTSIMNAVAHKEYWSGEIEITHKDKTSMLGWLTIDVVKEHSGEISNRVFMLTDISKIQENRDKMKHLATHDPLTQLPNRALLYDRIEHSIASMKRNNQKGAVIFIDIDYFKDINDNYGHHTGDLLLKAFAKRLHMLTRESDTVGRLGGDEFLLITENIETRQKALLIVQKLLKNLSEPFFITHQKIETSVSIGATLFPDDGESTERLIQAADQAMYAVKKEGRNGFEFYSKDLSHLSHEYLLVRGAIKRSLKENRFTILYQPQFSLHDGAFTGMEALLRCQDPIVSGIPISRMIQIAEESGLIKGISRFVLKKSCEQIKQWHTLSLDPIRVAVNLSRKELSDPTLVETIKTNLSTSGIGSLILEFEITESIFMKSNCTAKKNIEALREIGCLFSIDDFGTGFSSLSNLKEFDLDKLKIDQSFIANLETNSNDRIIVSATISMAQKLGLTVLAEGVETEAQKEILQKFGCDEAQGFLYSNPLSGEEMTDLLQSQKSLG